MLFNDGKLRGESCYYDHDWWTHQKYELGCFICLFFFFFWEKTSSTVIGIFTLHLFQCKIFSGKYFHILKCLFCSKILSQK